MIAFAAAASTLPIQVTRVDAPNEPVFGARRTGTQLIAFIAPASASNALRRISRTLDTPTGPLVAARERTPG